MDATLIAFPFVLTVGLSEGVSEGSSSLPVPVFTHPPSKQSRLHLAPSQCNLQFPPGHDMTHISAPASQYILQLPLVQV